MSKTLYIINPAGHGGAGLNVWDAFKADWGDPIEKEHIKVTERSGQAREIATAAEGYDTFVAVGGDGTVGEVMSAIMDREESDLKLAIIPAGTGNDIGRNIGVRSVQDSVKSLRGGVVKAFDIMRLKSLVNGKAVYNYGFLACGVGFSSIPRIRPWMKRLLGPKGAYYLATLIQLALYKPTNMTMKSEEKEHRGLTWLIMVGNSESTAGDSMRLAPGARIDDGELNISIFPGGSRIRMGLRLMPKISKGTHVEDPLVSYFPARELDIDSDPPAVIELDGDLYGHTPAKISVRPLAMRFMTPDTKSAKDERNR